MKDRPDLDELMRGGLSISEASEALEAWVTWPASQDVQLGAAHPALKD